MPVITTFEDSKILFAANLNNAFANTVSISGDSIQGPLTLTGTLTTNRVVANTSGQFNTLNVNRTGSFDNVTVSNTIITSIVNAANNIYANTITSNVSATFKDFNVSNVSGTTLTVTKDIIANNITANSTGTFGNLNVTSSIIPTNGMYLAAANTLGWSIADVGKLRLNSTALYPTTSDGLALGQTTSQWSDLYMAYGGVINFNNGSVTVTHSTNRLSVLGGNIVVTYNSTEGSGSTYIETLAGTQSVAHTGIFGAQSITPVYSATSGNTLVAMYGSVSNPISSSTGTITTLTGYRGIPTISGNSTISTIIGVSAVPVVSGAATVTTVYNLYSQFTNSNVGGTITNAYGLFLATPSNSGTITNRYGVYQQDPNSPNFFLGTVTGASFIPSSATVPTNGMYLPGTNILGFATNSTHRMRIDSSGNVGIGTTSPSRIFSVQKSIDNSASAFGANTSPAIAVINASGATFNEKAEIHLGLANGSGFSTVTGLYTVFNGSGDIGTALAFGTQQNLAGGTVERVRITSFGDVGVGTTTPSSRFHVVRNSTDTSGATYAMTLNGAQSVAHTGSFILFDSLGTYTATSGNTLNQMIGLRSAPTNSSTGTITALYGVYSKPTNSSTGTITALYGELSQPTNSSTGTITALYGGILQPINSSTGTITNTYAIYSQVVNSDAGGTMTNAYGLFLATPSNSGTITNRYGIYQQDPNSPNILFGLTLIGSATNDGSTNLQVNGTFKATGTSTLAAMSATTGAFSGNFAVATNKFTVASATGNTLVAGTLDVNGASSFAAISATTGAFTGATSINLSGVAISPVAGYVLGAAAADGFNTATLLDAVGVYPRHILRRSNGTSSSRTVVVLDDVLGSIEARGHDGSAFTTSRAGIDFVAAQNWSSSIQGGKIAFRTTVNGANTGAAIKMTLENSGALLIGGTTDDGTNKLRVTGGVTIDTGNSYKVNNVAVLGARKTGWTAATGSATRTTYDTTTVTLPQLAERVKALLDDLISHGIIGT